MDIDRTEEERLIRESARRFFASASAAPRAEADRPWQALATFGVADMFGDDATLEPAALRRLAILCEEAGAACVNFPIAEIVALAHLCSVCPGLAADPAVRAALAGETLVLPLVGTTPGEELTLRTGADGRELASGLFRRLPFAANAGAFVVLSARPDGRCLALLPADADGVARDANTLLDGTDWADIVVTDAPLTWFDLPTQPGTSLASSVSLLLMLGCAASLVGVALGVGALAREHLMTRRQFGRELASFQALQHRAASDHVARELSRSLVYHACERTIPNAQAPAMLHAAMAHASATAIAAAKSAVQFLGAAGYTEEYRAGAYLKRALVLSRRFGGPAAHKAAFAACHLELIPS